MLSSAPKSNPTGAVVAFYAPLKSPDHPTPSGDRLLARLLLQALQQAGFTPLLASRFRSRDGRGDPARQQRLKSVAQRLAQRLIRRYQRLPSAQRPRLWFTYHLYHKAPDWIGPVVAKALAIPYVVAEASYAEKQRHGPWQQGLIDSVAALQQAAAILCLNPADRPGLESISSAPLHTLAPFLDLTPFKARASHITPRTTLVRRYKLDPSQPWLISVAMMRPGDKQHSYRLLAEALKQCSTQPWQLLIIGEGSARSQIESYFQPLGRRCHFIGQRSHAEILPLLQASDLFVWPAVNEAFGMALLEAQAAATAVLAGDEGGVRSIVEHDRSGWLVPARDPQAFAHTLAQLLANQQRLTQAGIYAQRQVKQRHSLEAAGDRLRQLLGPLI
ncbi:MAG: glycosyltransferase family 4 protein [Motiliproteus sp.]